MSSIYKEVFLAALNAHCQNEGLSVRTAVDWSLSGADTVCGDEKIMQKISGVEDVSLRFTRVELERIVDYYSGTRLEDRSLFDVELIGKITSFLDEAVTACFVK